MACVFLAGARASRPRSTRFGLLVSVALLPLVHAAAAQAQTRIGSETTQPVSTSTIAGGQPDNLVVEAGGSIKLGGPGVAITLDSNNEVLNRGTLSADDQSDSAGVLILGGRAGRFENGGAINLVEGYTPADADSDGDNDGPLAQGARRFGIRAVGPAAFVGDIVNSGAITVEGNDSGGVSLETRLEGSFAHSGTVSVFGDRSVGVRATDVAGSVRVIGAISAVGQDAIGLDIGNVGGGVVIQTAVGATGYRTAERLPDAVRAKLDADDLLQGGPAVRISGSVGRGVLLDRQPADNDANNNDEDGDGIVDSTETTAVITSSGSAPALDIGGSGPVTLGRVGTGVEGYGLVIKGQVFGIGVNDGVSATAVRIGRPGGGAATLEGGLHLVTGGGAIGATAFEGDATAIQINAGANVPTVQIGGDVAAKTTASGARTATGLVIEAGATVSSLGNAGTIGVEVAGAAGTAQAIVDRSGSLAQIDNTGVIQAAVTPPEGASAAVRPVAIDLRANTSGAALRQWGMAADAAPRIVGDVLLGSGADRVEILQGKLTGQIAFGAGADSLLIDGGAEVSGPMSDSDGNLAIDVRKGRLGLAQTGVFKVSSLSLGSEADLAVTIDPQAGAYTRIESAGAATLATGAKISVTISSLLTNPGQYEILKAGSLTAGTLDGAVVGAPFLYVASLRAQPQTASLSVDVRRRTAEEAGLGRSESQAFDAVFADLERDADIRDAFLAKTDQAGFVGLYDQMLPDHSGGSLMSAAAISNAVSTAVAEHAGPESETNGGRLWLQEIFFDIDKERRQALGFSSRGFGLAGGIETTFDDGSGYGLNLSFVTADFKDRGAAVGEQVTMSFGEAGVYVRRTFGGLRADVRAAAGFVTFDSDRRVVSADDGLDRTSKADWNGWLADFHAGLSYEWRAGRLYAGPQATFDYLYLRESGYEEEGGGEGVDLGVDSRKGDLMLGAALFSVGARFGDQVRWGPELKVGWRERLTGGPGKTTARFLGGGSDFVLDAENPYSGGAVVRAALKGSGGGVLAALEGGGEFGDGYEQYDVRAVVKFSF